MELLADLDPFLDGLRRLTGSDAPASLQVALRGVEEALFALARTDDAQAVQRVLVAVSEAEAVIARSGRLRTSGVTPLSLSEQWGDPNGGADDASPEWRIARAIASLLTDPGGMPPLRCCLEPVVLDGRRWKFTESVGPQVVWRRGHALATLANVLLLRSRAASSGEGDHDTPGSASPLRSAWAASVGDVARLLAGGSDLDRIDSLVRGLACVRWRRRAEPHTAPSEPDADVPPPGVAWTTIAALLHPSLLSRTSETTPPLLRLASLTRLLEAGRTRDAVDVGLRRLQLAGFDLLVDSAGPWPAGANSSALLAALAVPVAERELVTELRRICLPPEYQSRVA